MNDSQKKLFKQLEELSLSLSSLLNLLSSEVELANKEAQRLLKVEDDSIEANRWRVQGIYYVDRREDPNRGQVAVKHIEKCNPNIMSLNNQIKPLVEKAFNLSEILYLSLLSSRVDCSDDLNKLNEFYILLKKNVQLGYARNAGNHFKLSELQVQPVISSLFSWENLRNRKLFDSLNANRDAIDEPTWGQLFPYPFQLGAIFLWPNVLNNKHIIPESIPIPTREINFLEKIFLSIIFDNPEFLAALLAGYLSKNGKNALEDFVRNHLLLGLTTANGRLECSKILLQSGAQLEQKFTLTFNESSPQCYANQLLQSKVKNYKNSNLELTPFALAIAAAPLLNIEQAKKIIKLFLELRADHNFKITKTWTEERGYYTARTQITKSSKVTLFDFDESGLLSALLNELRANKTSRHNIKAKEHQQHTAKEIQAGPSNTIKNPESSTEMQYTNNPTYTGPAITNPPTQIPTKAPTPIKQPINNNTINHIPIIQYSALVIEQPPLGEGTFGIVYHAKWQYEDVAVKQLKLQVLDEKTKQEFDNEAKIMEKLRSEFIIGLRGICTGPYCLVLEYAPNGPLDKYLRSNQDIPWPKRYDIAIKIGKGLAFLHNQNPPILHRDLKSMNVLLDINYAPKLTDFGLAKIKLESTSKMTVGAAGTPAWMAPELFADEPQHTVAADVYSLAIILWEIANRQMPFANLNALQIMFAIANNKRPDFPDSSCSKGYKDLVILAWQKEADKRPALSVMVQNLENLSQQGSSQNSGYMSFSK